MEKRFFLVVLTVLLAAGHVMAAPQTPSNFRAEPHPNGFALFWDYPGSGEVSFKLYRGLDTLNVEEIATVEENYFLDTAPPDQNFYYKLTAVDETGESIIPAGLQITVQDTKPDEKPFTVTLLGPKGKSFKFGEKVEFIIKIESDRFEDLQGLRAVIENEVLGIEQEMVFDSEKKFFTATVQLPKEQPDAVLANFEITVSATVDGSEYQEPITGPLTILPVEEAELGWPILIPIIVFSLFIVVAGFAHVWGVWSSKRKERFDNLNMELLEVHKERAIWKHDMFKRRITPEQFREREGELQAKQVAVEEKLGVKHVKGKARANPFEGFSPAEIEETIRLVKSIGKPRQGETPEGLRARLVGLGRSEKIAKKVVKLVFRK